MSLQSKVKAMADKGFASTRKIRRHLHQYPELSYQEKETGKYIASTLKALGIKHETGWADNGVVAYIQGKQSNKKVIALRADIDALPITEANKVSYKSKNKGVMHACGHDVHTASLLGAAKILHSLRDNFGGKVVRLDCERVSIWLQRMKYMLPLQVKADMAHYHMIV